MSLSLACSCGARFEVEETFAGQNIGCPECHQSLPVPRLDRKPLRTSACALASAVLALLLAFTGIGTLIAVILGIIGLAHISRHRDEVTGTGYAIFGIAGGAILTGLFAFAVIQTELFGFNPMREGLMGHQVERGGPLEISRPADGFSIRRPSNQWYIAKPEFAKELVPDSVLVLVNLGRDVYLDVTPDHLNGRSLETYRDDVIDTFKQQRDQFGRNQPGVQPRDLVIRHSKKLPDDNGMETMEVLLDVRIGPQHMTYLLRMVRSTGSDRVFLLRGWALKRRFPVIEDDLRRALDSFRIIKP